jgi:hypothetical protein
MAKKRKRKCENPETWRRRIETWKRSGLGVTEFAAQEGLCTSTFLRWRKKLDETSSSGVCHEQIPPSTQQRQGEAEERTQALSFVELTPRSTESPVDITCGVPFEVGLRSGRRLQVPAKFDPETLRQLVAILEVQ